MRSDTRHVIAEGLVDVVAVDDLKRSKVGEECSRDGSRPFVQINGQRAIIVGQRYEGREAFRRDQLLKVGW